jgi:hypothetical protein
LANALKNSQENESTDDRPPGHEERAALIDEIARSTESSVRNWRWLRDLSQSGGGRPVDAILYPSTMAGAAALTHRLETSGIEWHVIGGFEGRRSRRDRPVVAISLRLLDESLLFDGDQVRVHAGYSVSALAFAAAERGLSGLEPLTELGGGLGEFLRPGRRGDLWHLVEEVVVTRQGLIKIVLTRGEGLTPDQRTAIDGSLILAATLRLSRPEEGVVRLNAKERLTGVDAATDGTGGKARTDGESLTGGVIPLSERAKGRAVRELQLELEYDVDASRDES